MFTELSYVGKGCYASPTEQTGNSATQTVENRPPILWKPFPRLGHLFELSSTGQVRSLQTGLPVKTHICQGQEVFRLPGKSSWKTYHSISEAVALAFVPNPLGYPTVLPIDPSKPLTHADNLKWGTKRGTCRGVKAFTAKTTNHTFQPYSEYLLDRLLAEGRLSKVERYQAGIFTVQDDCMSSIMPETVRFVAVPVDSSRYQTLVGKVVQVVVKADRFAYYLGRVVSITPNCVRVSRDNKEWSDRIESRLVIASIARVVSILESPIS